MPAIKNQNELEEALEKYIKIALEKTKKIVYDNIDESINQFYTEYVPIRYQRTYAFLESLVHTDIVKKGNTYTCEVKIDDSYLKYKYPGNSYNDNIPATGFDVAMWADRQGIGFNGGNHGYTVNTGRNDGFWNTAIEELGDIPGLVCLFRDNLIKTGLLIK